MRIIRVTWILAECWNVIKSITLSRRSKTGINVTFICCVYNKTSNYIISLLSVLRIGSHINSFTASFQQSTSRIRADETSVHSLNRRCTFLKLLLDRFFNHFLNFIFFVLLNLLLLNIEFLSSLCFVNVLSFFKVSKLSSLFFKLVNFVEKRFGKIWLNYRPRNLSLTFFSVRIFYFHSVFIKVWIFSRHHLVNCSTIIARLSFSRFIMIAWSNRSKHFNTIFYSSLSIFSFS